MKRPKFTTMNDAYEDKSDHLVCEVCGACLTCGDCMCNELWRKNARVRK